MFEKIDQVIGIEKKLDNESAEKDSEYAYVIYTDTINCEEINSKGEIVLLKSPSYAGQIDLVTAKQFKKLSTDFPNKVKGDIIKYNNLENMISYCFNNLCKEYAELDEKESTCDMKIEEFGTYFENGKISAFHPTISSINDLANKYSSLQNDVREFQVIVMNRSNSIKK